MGNIILTVIIPGREKILDAVNDAWVHLNEMQKQEKLVSVS